MKNITKGLWLFVLIGFVWESPVYAASSKLDKAIKSYEKKVVQAEQKDCNTDLGKPIATISKRCEKAMKKLDKIFDKYSDEIKSDAKIGSLRERQEKLRGLLDGLAHQATVEKAARNYRHRIEHMESKSCLKKESYGSRDAYVCLEDVEKADKIKERIPAELLDEPVIKDLIARHDALKKMPEYMDNIYADKNAKFLENAGLVGDFDNTVHDISYWNQLAVGKANKPADIGYVDGLKKDLPRIKQLAVDCKGKYAEIVKNSAGRDRQAKCELAENADKYYAQLAVTSYQRHLQQEIKDINAVIARLTDDGYIELSDYKKLVLGSKGYVRELKQNIGESHKLAGLAEPSYAELDAAVAKIPEAIKVATSKNENRWADEKTVSVSDAIEERTAQVVKKMGFELVKVGRQDEPWTLVKNGLGVPLYKGTKGWVMMKDSKDSFCRMQHASFTRAYDGTGYAAASNVGIVPAIVPVPCD
ncbi:hypothetical protein [Vibrio gazogenes]|uniref:Uncharacterized protein n=1 Tax=Vibrio gazogenes DSM 21264 = NBRC 103151 TaxID=1123492 RepID=A0A1M4T2S5_VIBGA|nr:hypothetical protein [Vibrio gazogenes]USP16009.1 hypothetical protein MKS89_16610 [Vibrio gazogenes]SHE38745.1 hypothetical protein SAMN02745781_00223 [Vibrio gazogenes DSM 21264] [Vibrio gazogenes DSM 21264 = NBRC 103151]SJN58527.1 hypothetical protein BQ6471_03061 [Vibrio gazogenes]